MNSQFCTARADEAATAAGQTNLLNVRERLLRSEAAWRAMAEQLQRTEDHRKAVVAAKAKARDGAH